LRAERQQMTEGTGGVPAWLEGVDDLTLASHDLLAVMVLYPAL
jgi:hypothetical protein